MGLAGLCRRDVMSMDIREYLKKNDRLLFPGMECVVEAPVGRGANVLAYVGHYKDHLNPELYHRVLIRELFPYDPYGKIFRGKDGSLVIEGSARSLYEYHRLSFFAREQCPYPHVGGSSR